METALVEVGSGAHDLSLAGKVAYGEDRYSRISSPIQGRVLEVRAHLGERVQAGSVLLVLDSQEIAQAYSEYVKEDSDLQYATRARELAKDLYENKALPLKDLKQAENELIKARAEFRRGKERLLSLRVPAQELEKPLDRQQITSRFEMKSPLTGVVVERNVTPGQSIGGESGQVLFTVADLDLLQVVADVYERDLASVKEGQFAMVNVEAYPDVSFPATVATIGDVVDPTSRTIKLRAWVNNKDHRLKPEMFARLHIQVGESAPLLTIPREAVLEVDGKQFVYRRRRRRSVCQTGSQSEYDFTGSGACLGRPDIGTTHRDQRRGLDQGAGSQRITFPRAGSPPSNWNLIAPHDSQNR